MAKWVRISLGIGVLVGGAGLLVIGLGLNDRLTASVYWRMPRPEPEPIQIPDRVLEEATIILAIGQSNAASHGFPRSKGGGNVFAFHDGRFYPGKDPWPGSSGKGGSVWPLVGRMLVATGQAQSVIVAAPAIGSSKVRQWAPGGELHGHLKMVLEDMAANGLEPDWVIWHQGESEALDGTVSGRAYLADLQAVMQTIRASGLESPTLVCLATRHRDSPPDEEIRSAQRSVWNADARIYAGVDTDSFGERFRWDGVHFNKAGFEKFAAGLIRAMEKRSDAEAVVLGDVN